MSNTDSISRDILDAAAAVVAASEAIDLASEDERYGAIRWHARASRILTNICADHGANQEAALNGWHDRLFN
jgi:hypothetical protein